MNPTRLSFLLLCLGTIATAQNPNNTLRGKVLYQSSGNKPAVGVRIAEPDANAAFSVNNGEYQLKFQSKRNGSALKLEVGKDDGKGRRLEIVNEKEIKSAKLPAKIEDILEIIVCPAEQRDIAVRKYYNILRSTADLELEKKKKEVSILMAQKEIDFEKINELSAKILEMKAALDSVKILEQAFNLANINLDRASQMVKDAMKKIEDKNDVGGALIILNMEKIDSVYQKASDTKKKSLQVYKKAENEIKQSIVAYETRISILETNFEYGEIAVCYEKIIEIYENEHYDTLQLSEYQDKAAIYLNRNGKFNDALEFNKKALANREKILQADHPDLASSYNEIAVTYINLGEYQKALEFNQKTLTIKEKALPINYNDLAVVYNNIAENYGKLGNYQKQLDYNLKVLDIREKTLSANDFYLAESYNNLADTYTNRGDTKKSKEFHLKALSIWEKILPDNHPTLASSYSNLASAYGALGEYDNQLIYNQKALAIRKKVLSPNHPDIAQSYNNLAATYNHLGDFSKQLECNLEALSIRKKSLPPDHQDMAQTYGNLAMAYGNLGDYQKKLEFNRLALAILEKRLSPDHPDLAQCYSNIAATYTNLGDYPQAIDFFLKALPIQEKTGANPHDLGITYMNLATTYGYLGQSEKALEFNLKAGAVFEASLPDGHPDLGLLYANLAYCYSDVGNHEKELEYDLKAIKIQEKALAANHPDLGISYNNINFVYRDLGQFGEAIKYGLKAIQVGESSVPKPAYLNRFYANLGITYLKAHQFPEAKSMLEKGESLKQDERVFQGWAMYYALQKNKPRAVEYLQKSASLGLKDLKWLETEPDLKNIRKEKGYKEIVEQLKKQ